MCSFKIDDWRYRSEVDKIISHLYVMTKTFGRARASDDIVELHLFDFDKVKLTDIVPEHHEMFNALSKWRNEYLKKSPPLSKSVENMMD